MNAPPIHAAPVRDAGSAPAFFDGEAARYDAAYDAPTLPGFSLRDRMRTVLELMPAPGGRVLDAGMGGGRLVAELDRRGWEVTGIDGSAEMVALAQARLPEARDRLLVAQLERLPFPDGSFDAIVATGAVEYADDLNLALAELARVLAPGGAAIVSMPSVFAPYPALRREVLYPALRLAKRLGLVERAPFARSRPPRLKRFKQLLADVSLNVEAVGFANRFPFVTPFERMFPVTSVRAAERLAESESRLARAFAGQLVFVARKRACTP